jgi:hypothetical protein
VKGGKTPLSYRASQLILRKALSLDVCVQVKATDSTNTTIRSAVNPVEAEVGATLDLLKLGRESKGVLSSWPWRSPPIGDVECTIAHEQIARERK